MFGQFLGKRALARWKYFYVLVVLHKS